MQPAHVNASRKFFFMNVGQVSSDVAPMTIIIDLCDES